MRHLVFIATAVLSPVAPAHAAFYTGNDLFEHCSKSDTGSKALCFGYIIGVADGFRDASVTVICLPPNVTAGQVQDVVLKQLEDDPSQRHNTAAWSIGTALAASFPC